MPREESAAHSQAGEAAPLPGQLSAPAYCNVDARSAPAWLGLAKVLDMRGGGEEAGEARRRAAELEARK